MNTWIYQFTIIKMKNNLWSEACYWFPRPSDDDSLDENDDSDHNDEK